MTAQNERKTLLAYESLCTSLINALLEIMEQLKTEQHAMPISSKLESLLHRYKRRLDRIDYEWTHTNGD